VRAMRQLRKELGSEHGTVKRVAEQLGIGTESLPNWVRQADIDDGAKPGLSREDAEKLKRLEQENRELKRTNETCARRRRISPRRNSTAHRRIVGFIDEHRGELGVGHQPTVA